MPYAHHPPTPNAQRPHAHLPTLPSWDPVFLPDGHAHTYAEMDKTVKNSISHRYHSVAALRAYLIKEHEAISARLLARSAGGEPAAAVGAGGERQ